MFSKVASRLNLVHGRTTANRLFEVSRQLWIELPPAFDEASMTLLNVLLPGPVNGVLGLQIPILHAFLGQPLNTAAIP